MKLERAIKEKKGEKKKNVKVLPRNIGGKSANVFFFFIGRFKYVKEIMLINI